MLCVFEKIWGKDKEGRLVVVEEGDPIHPKHLRFEDGRPTHLTTHLTMARGDVPNFVPLNPEKFSIREPATPEEWYWARKNQVPEIMEQAMRRDVYLNGVMHRWFLTGQIPMDMDAVNPGDPNAPPPEMKPADLTEALAHALVSLVANKQGIVAAFTSKLGHAEQHGAR